MMKIDKRYTIKFSYAGIWQYAEFYEKDGKLINNRLFVSYSNEKDIPSIEGLETIGEVLEVIKTFSYNEPVIYLINGTPVTYHNNDEAKKYLTKFNDKFDTFRKTETIKYFESVLEPIIIKNKWYISTSHIGFPILIEKNDDEGEWDNVKDDYDFEFLCYKFISHFKDISISLKGEQGPSVISAFREIFNAIGLYTLLPAVRFIKTKI